MKHNIRCDKNASASKNQIHRLGKHEKKRDDQLRRDGKRTLKFP